MALPLTTTRTLHLVDIENLVGDPMATKEAALGALDDYLTLAGHTDGDQVIIAANPGLIARIGFDRPVPCSLHAARGKDGADLVLLSHAEPARIAIRFDRLAIGSGDGEFADTARAVRDRGAPVTVVARRRSLSRRLQGEGLGIRFLPEPSFAFAR